MVTNISKKVKANFALAAILLSSTGLTIGLTNTPSYARRRNCQAAFTVSEKTTKFMYMGNFRGGLINSKRKKCLDAATNYANNTLRVEDIPGIDEEQTKEAICEQGAIEVFIQTDVDGKRNNRNGFTRSKLNVGCTTSPTSGGGSGGNAVSPLAAPMQ